MLEVYGKHGSAKIFTDKIDEKTYGQIVEICNQVVAEDVKIRIMPDVHAGAGCVIGTTMEIRDKVVPNFVGVDIGCGLHVAKLEVGKNEVDFAKLDEVIHSKVPYGRNVHEGFSIHRFADMIDYSKLRCQVSDEHVRRSLGTLGDGNHFIELNADDDGQVYLVIHSGSRHLGVRVASHYQKEGYRAHMHDSRKERNAIIEKLKAEGRHREIEAALKAFKPSKPHVNPDTAYVEGGLMEDYLNDMDIAQDFARLNRRAMVDIIVKAMGWKIVESFDSIHNYIDLDNMIMRKGAISAKKGEVAIIPMNMRDGSLIVVGKGNPEWNESAPHGAGRIMSRSMARENISLDEYREAMKGVWTTSVGETTIDEAPMAYKPMEAITKFIGDTVDVVKVIRPLYNFKAH